MLDNGSRFSALSYGLVTRRSARMLLAKKEWTSCLDLQQRQQTAGNNDSNKDHNDNDDDECDNNANFTMSRSSKMQSTRTCWESTPSETALSLHKPQRQETLNDFADKLLSDMPAMRPGSPPLPSCVTTSCKSTPSKKKSSRPRMLLAAKQDWHSLSNLALSARETNMKKRKSMRGNLLSMSSDSEGSDAAQTAITTASTVTNTTTTATNNNNMTMKNISVKLSQGSSQHSCRLSSSSSSSLGKGPNDKVEENEEEVANPNKSSCSASPAGKRKSSLSSTSSFHRRSMMDRMPSVLNLPMGPALINTASRDDKMEEAERWESMTSVLSAAASAISDIPKPATRKASLEKTTTTITTSLHSQNGINTTPEAPSGSTRIQMMQGAQRWTSSSSLLSPQKPRRTLEIKLPSSLSIHTAPAASSSSHRSSRMVEAERLESSFSVTSSSSSCGPSKPTRKESTDDLPLLSSLDHEEDASQSEDEEHNDDVVASPPPRRIQMQEAERWESSLTVVSSSSSTVPAKPTRKESTDELPFLSSLDQEEESQSEEEHDNDIMASPPKRRSLLMQHSHQWRSCWTVLGAATEQHRSLSLTQPRRGCLSRTTSFRMQSMHDLGSSTHTAPNVSSKPPTAATTTNLSRPTRASMMQQSHQWTSCLAVMGASHQKQKQQPRRGRLSRTPSFRAPSMRDLGCSTHIAPASSEDTATPGSPQRPSLSRTTSFRMPSVRNLANSSESTPTLFEATITPTSPKRPSLSRITSFRMPSTRSLATSAEPASVIPKVKTTTPSNSKRSSLSRTPSSRMPSIRNLITATESEPTLSEMKTTTPSSPKRASLFRTTSFRMPSIRNLATSTESVPVLSASLSTLGGHSRFSMMKAAERWESSSSIASPQKPRRTFEITGIPSSLKMGGSSTHTTPDVCNSPTRSNMMQDAERWESSSSVTSPQKPRRTLEITGMSSVLPLSTKLCNSPTTVSMIKDAVRGESSPAISLPQQPQRSSESKDKVGIAPLVSPKSPAASRARLILQSSEWGNFSSSFSTPRSRKLRDAERWYSTSEEKLNDQSPCSPESKTMLGTAKAWKSCRVSSSTTASRARDLLAARGWESLLTTKKEAPTLATCSSRNPPVQIATFIESESESNLSSPFDEKKSLQRVRDIHASLKEKREKFSNVVHQIKASPSPIKSISMSPRVTLSKERALESLSAKRERLAKLRLAVADNKKEPKAPCLPTVDLDMLESSKTETIREESKTEEFFFPECSRTEILPVTAEADSSVNSEKEQDVVASLEEEPTETKPEGRRKVSFFGTALVIGEISSHLFCHPLVEYDPEEDGPFEQNSVHEEVGYWTEAGKVLRVKHNQRVADMINESMNNSLGLDDGASFMSEDNDIEDFDDVSGDSDLYSQGSFESYLDSCDDEFMDLSDDGCDF